MPDSPLITLLTDFGTQDAYVGILKGVIAQICPIAQVVDLTHRIPPQDRLAARFNLLNAYPYFPRGTIHLVVVDPGVGTERRGVAIQTSRAFLVGPDNGVFSGILQTHPALAAVTLTNPQYWYAATISSTFHGRDIFAPVAAHLADGIPLAALGETIDPDSLVSLDIPVAIAPTPDTRQGVLQYIDHFGNLITNLSGQDLPGDAWVVHFQGQVLPGHQTYGEVAPGTPVVLVGSHGWVEIAINGGNAQAILQAQVGDGVWLQSAASLQ